MPRSDRLFDIIQALRSRKKPMTAAALAEELEVTPRTVYRDIATLQARRVPIEGAAGVGYVLRKGFDLPPLMFTIDEVEAIAIGAAIRDSRKLYIGYADTQGRRTNRVIWPIAMAYYVDATLVGAWCELRADYRNFRIERIQSSKVLRERFDQQGGKLFREWSALPKHGAEG
jgi:predicted DNA-binding transcriptional regulator YafY